MTRALALLAALVATTGVLRAQGSDDCANAQVINGVGSFPWDNTAATKDGPNDCDGQPARKDVWFKWQAPGNGAYIIQDCGTSTIASRIVVYDDQACPVSAPPIMCGSTGCPGMGTRFSFPTVMGQDYLIRIGSRIFGESGTGTFDIQLDPCSVATDDPFEDNDFCPDAIQIVDGFYPNMWTAKADNDWFLLDVADGATLTVNFVFTHANGDIDVFLYDACDGTTLDSSISGDDDEDIAWTNNTGACLTTVMEVQIWPPDENGDCNNYDMTVTGSSPAGTCNPSIGNNYCGPANPNSTGLPGIIAGNGSVLVADNNVTLTAFQLPPNQFGMFLNSMTQGFIQNPGGSQGNLCLKGSIGRYNRPGEIKGSGAGGEFSLVLDLTDTPQPTGSVSIMAGETWNFTTWFRDIGGNSNFTDGLEIMFL